RHSTNFIAMESVWRSSNFTAAMLRTNLQAAGLSHFFEEHLTTDRVRAFKPSPRAYQMGMDYFQCDRQEIVFAAFAPWDAAGAKWFGYRTAWINRANVPPEELSVNPDSITPGLSAPWSLFLICHSLPATPARRADKEG